MQNGSGLPAFRRNLLSVFAGYKTSLQEVVKPEDQNRQKEGK